MTTKRLSLAALLLAGVLGCRPAEPPPPAPPPVPEAPIPLAPVPETDSQSAAAATVVIREYYEAINRKDYERVYHRWGGGGAASGKTYESFVRGFSGTESVTVDVGSPSRIEGAAGSRYVTVPVAILATAADGATQLAHRLGTDHGGKAVSASGITNTRRTSSERSVAGR